jgi:hypothetical protein
VSSADDHHVVALAVPKLRDRAPRLRRRWSRFRCDLDASRFQSLEGAVPGSNTGSSTIGCASSEAGIPTMRTLLRPLPRKRTKEQCRTTFQFVPYSRVDGGRLVCSRTERSSGAADGHIVPHPQAAGSTSDHSRPTPGTNCARGITLAIFCRSKVAWIEGLHRGPRGIARRRMPGSSCASPSASICYGALRGTESTTRD